MMLFSQRSCRTPLEIGAYSNLVVSAVSENKGFGENNEVAQDLISSISG